MVLKYKLHSIKYVEIIILAWQTMANPENSVTKPCLPSSSLWIQGCGPRSHGPKIRIIFLRACASDNMSQPGHAHPQKHNYEKWAAPHIPCESGLLASVQWLSNTNYILRSTYQQ